MLPAQFTAVELFSKIASLSYTGDWRMVFGENPHKVANIVVAQLPRFFALHGPVLANSFPSVSVSGHVGNGEKSTTNNLKTILSDTEIRHLRFEKDVRSEARLMLGAGLPIHVQQCMAEMLSSSDKSPLMTNSLTGNFTLTFTLRERAAAFRAG
jgi:hypothetical protein